MGNPLEDAVVQLRHQSQTAEDQRDAAEHGAVPAPTEPLYRDLNPPVAAMVQLRADLGAARSEVIEAEASAARNAGGREHMTARVANALERSSVMEDRWHEAVEQLRVCRDQQSQDERRMLLQTGAVEGAMEMRLRRQLAEAMHRAAVAHQRCRAWELKLERVATTERALRLEIQQLRAEKLQHGLTLQDTMPARLEQCPSASGELSPGGGGGTIGSNGVESNTLHLQAQVHELSLNLKVAEDELALARRQVENYRIELPILQHRCAEQEDATGTLSRGLGGLAPDRCQAKIQDVAHEVGLLVGSIERGGASFRDHAVMRSVERLRELLGLGTPPMGAGPFMDSDRRTGMPFASHSDNVPLGGHGPSSFNSGKLIGTTGAEAARWEPVPPLPPAPTLSVQNFMGARERMSMRNEAMMLATSGSSAELPVDAPFAQDISQKLSMAIEQENVNSARDERLAIRDEAMRMAGGNETPSSLGDSAFAQDLVMQLDSAVAQFADSPASMAEERERNAMREEALRLSRGEPLPSGHPSFGMAAALGTAPDRQRHPPPPNKEVRQTSLLSSSAHRPLPAPAARALAVLLSAENLLRV